MYKQFYGLREKPFSLTPDPVYLFLATQHRYALTMLEYAISQGSGFALVTGEVGCSKTTVVRHFLGQARRQLNAGLISNTHSGFGALLPWVMQALGLNAGAGIEGELYQHFVEHVNQEFDAGRRTVLVIDEAQNLCVDALEQLRVLSNLNAGKHQLLQTILVGQPELRETLRWPALRQFAQRIAIEYHIEPLQREDAHAYVRHCLAVAGGSSDLIAADALELVHARAGGVPRLVNIICDTALVYGFADQRHSIEADTIWQVLRDRSAGGVLALHGVTHTSPSSSRAG